MILEEILNINKLRDEIKQRKDRLQEDEVVLYQRKSQMTFELYLEFMKNNWDSLSINSKYYYLSFDKMLRIEKIKFIKMFSNFAVFKPINIDQHHRDINLFANVIEADYNSSSAVIDENQLSSVLEVAGEIIKYKII